MLTKLCKKCGKLIPYPLTYCDKCRPKPKDKAKETRYYDKNRRDKRSTAFYNSKEWRALSAYVLMINNYQCAECGKVATEVHHIIEVKDDWSKRLDIDNLQPLCTSCHTRARNK